MAPIRGAPAPGECHGINRKAKYITAVAVMNLIALGFTAIAFLGNALGLKSNDLHRKHLFYKVAIGLALLSGK